MDGRQYMRTIKPQYSQAQTRSSRDEPEPQVGRLQYSQAQTRSSRDEPEPQVSRWPACQKPEIPERIDLNGLTILHSNE
jgi:hypothetical protein